MTYTQALVLGVVQGLTEFLPISSSGHLILVPHIFGWPDQGLAFDAIIHLGTLGALVAYFRGELLALLRGTLSCGLAALLVAATIPGALAGLLFEGVIETELRSPLLIAGSLAFWGLVMAFADRRAPPPPKEGDEPLARIGWSQGLAVGVAQAIALVPGTSRSGITITTGLLVGLDRETAARYSFLLGLVITACAGSKKALNAFHLGIPAGEGGPLAVALIGAFVSGWFAVWFLVAYLRRGSLLPFVVYRLALAAAIVAVAT